MNAYRTGFDAVQEAVEKASRDRQLSGGSMNFISWADGTTHILRFVDDAPITIGFHEYIKCLDGKFRNFVCAKQLAEPRDCWICDNLKRDTKNGPVPLKPRDMTIAIAAEREERRDGRSFEYLDILEDVEVGDEELLKKLKEIKSLTIEGSTVKQIPKVGLVVQAVSNFWSQMNGYYSRYETSVDRDYEIKRTGKKLDTKYLAIPCDPIDGLKTREEVADRYLVSTTIHPTVVDYIERLGSEGFYEANLYGDDKSSGSSDSNESSEGRSSVPHDSGAESSGPSSTLADQLRGWGNKK